MVSLRPSKQLGSESQTFEKDKPSPGPFSSQKSKKFTKRLFSKPPISKIFISLSFCAFLKVFFNRVVGFWVRFELRRLLEPRYSAHKSKHASYISKGGELVKG
jgi:hypothetical protein